MDKTLVTRSLVQPRIIQDLLSAYAVAGFEPDFVSDFVTEYYRANGTVAPFGDLFTHERPGNATMVDSDGLVKWAPHNYFLNSDTPVTQTIAVVDGAVYTVEVSGPGSVNLSDSASGSASNGSPLSVISNGTNVTATVVGNPTSVWFYRSDLGGMVNNPDTGDSYVPTDGEAVYLPRRGHHTWDGAAWVNQGLLIESEDATNLIEDSVSMANSFATDGVAITDGVAAASPTGSTATRLTGADGQDGRTYVQKIATMALNQSYTFGFFVKSDGVPWVRIRSRNEANVSKNAWFDLQSGTFGFSDYDTAEVVSLNDGWYFLHVVVDSGDADLTSALFTIELADGDNSSAFIGDGIKSVLVTGTQIEQNGFPTSYIPTNGAVVTRPGETLVIAAANAPAYTDSFSIQLGGVMSYADNSTTLEVVAFEWQEDANNFVRHQLSTTGSRDGQPLFYQREGTSGQQIVDGPISQFLPGLHIPINLAARHGNTFVNGASSGLVFTENVSPTILADLSQADIAIATKWHGPISVFRVWGEDITDAGLLEATS